MMKEKMKVPLLIACAAVWGGVGYSFFYKGSEEGNVQVRATKNYEPIVQENDTFKLLLDYPEPFSLQAETQSSRRQSISVPTRRTVRSQSSGSKNLIDARLKSADKKRNPKKVVFPRVEYNGMVKERSGSPSAIVRLDGIGGNWTRGTMKDGILLSKVYPDSIIIVKEGKSKTIKRGSN